MRLFPRWHTAEEVRAQLREGLRNGTIVLSECSMSDPARGTEDERHQILLALDETIDRARSYLKSYSLWDNPIVIAGIFFGGAATALAGFAAYNNKAPEFMGSWPTLCYAVAALAFLGTIANAIHKGVRVHDNVITGKQCLAALESLKLRAADMEPQAIRSKLADLREIHQDSLAFPNP